MDEQSLQLLKTKLHKTGWDLVSLGQTRSNGKTRPVRGFLAFVRDRPFGDFLAESPKKVPANPCKPRGSGTGSSSSMGIQKGGLTPTPAAGDLPPLADFESYPSLMAARPDSPCILVGYDSEWDSLVFGMRDMLSWQFAVVWDVRLVEICFLKDGDRNLGLDLALGFLLDYLGVPSVDVRKIRRYMYCNKWSGGKAVVSVTDSLREARENCCYVYRGGNVDGGFTHELIADMDDQLANRSGRDWSYFHTFLDYKGVDSIKVTLLCHAGKVDLTGLDGTDYILRHLTEVQGGLVSLQPIRLAPVSLKKASHKYVYPLALSIADTMCHAPAGLKKLEDLGAVVGIPKIDIPVRMKKHMRGFLESDPAGFLGYASTDSVITLLYSSALYGYNNRPPVTLTSAAAKVMKKSMMEYFGIDNDDTACFDRVYRGLVKVSHGKCALPDRPGFIENTSLEPVSEDANRVQDFSSKAFHGGYNACCEVGYFPRNTYDYDLRNAYPTSMCLVTDVDWENPIRFQINGRKLDIHDFQTSDGMYNPVMPFVCYCRFQFPDSVKYPCIPVNVDGIPVYPRSSDGLGGVYAAGPCIYLALRLGAEVYCQYGYVLNSLLRADMRESRSLSHAVRQLVLDRSRAVDDHGKKSLEELILKVMVNSGYGKTAQNVVPKHTWSAYKNMMEDLGCSDITNPVSAMMTTAIVQCVLLASQNQLHDLGYMACSVTTDGFISDCPYDVLTALDLYGFRHTLERARLFLTDGKNPGLWEAKHHQNDLVNFTTRGNVSLLRHGVCAHNSAKSGYKSDSYEDRLWLMTRVLSRTGTIDCTDAEWASFKNIVQGKTDFRVNTVTRHLHMDFDLKRKPVRGSFSTDHPVIDGVTYEIAHFDTEPYENIAEFRLYRKKKSLFDCLRTEEEWKLFFTKVDTDGCNCIVKDLDWSILASVIMGYRAGKWDIPALEGKTVAEKCDWINQHNGSTRKFKESDWKNARRPERQASMLPEEFLKDKLLELQNSV